MTRYGFATNIPELIRRLGMNLYNDPTISLRELVQNANDACILAEGFYGASRGRIEVAIDPQGRTVAITDNGIGMTAKDLHDVLSTIASTGKAKLRKELEERNFHAARGIAGQFGIGFLSTFIIAKEVSIETRHTREKGPGSRWHSIGDGDYDLSPSPKPLPQGTTVTLKLKEEFWGKVTPATASQILVQYCPFIRTPYYINGSILPANHELPPWSDSDDQSLADSYLRANFGDMRPLVGFYISHDGPVSANNISVPQLSLSGYLAIPDSRLWYKKPRVYTSGLYVGDIGDGLPPWARFIVGGIECPDLDLTLGRDNVMKNVTWRAVKKVVESELTGAIVRELGDARSRIRERWSSVFKIHDEDILRAAVEDARHGTGHFYRAIRDIVPFRIGAERISLSTAVEQGKCIEKDGKRMLFYFAHGFRNHESAGVQESLLFDEVGWNFIDARNYYERDFLQQYGNDNRELQLVPVEEGLEHVLDFNCDQDDARIVSETYKVLGFNARLAKFSPAELAAVIIPVADKGRSEQSMDLATPEGREQILQLLAGAANPGSYRPYTLCINANNVLVQELLKYSKDHGIDVHIKAALKQIYFMAVLVFGDTNTRVIAEMAPGLSSLMLSFLRRSTDQEAEVRRLREIVAEDRDRLQEKDEELARYGLGHLGGKEDGTVFLAYGYDDEAVKLVQPLKDLLTDRGIKVIDGKADRVGSLSEQVIQRLRSCSMFVGVLTGRDRLAGKEGAVTSAWVLEEMGAARGCGIPVFLIVDSGVADQFFGNLDGDNYRLQVGSGQADWAAAFREATNTIARSLRLDHGDGGA